MTTARFILCFLFLFSTRAAENEAQMAFLRAQVERIEAQTLDDWKTEAGREQRRKEALEMFGLSPMSERGDLKATVTGKRERDGVVVENLHFQSSPGLYVTGNFYKPANAEGKLPTILYVCGHAQVKTNGVSFGNKVAYQHHGIWFARHGYACLVIDTVQLGEIEGIHHGTYREGMWWWNSRGYSSAAVEAWNCIRALDYLETRPEVDKEKFGVTGRSGGGAYSWSLIALDPRVKAAAPVAGITDLRNHVIDGTVEGHCDCMFFVNTYGWDYPMLAALAAPRPLLIVNTDADSIFPLDGVVRTHKKLADLYKSLKAGPKIGLVIGPGGHNDTQDIQVPVFRWFNQHLKGEAPKIERAAEPLFTTAELKVFEKIPEDQRVTNVHEWFVPAATNPPKDRRELRAALEQKVFRNWPTPGGYSEAKASGDFELKTDAWTTIKVRRIGNGGKTRVRIVDPEKAEPFEAPSGESVWYVTPRGVGGDAKTKTQMRRRYMLVGTTLASMQVWDIRRALEAIGPVDTVEASGEMAVNLALASLFLPESARPKLSLSNLPADLRSGPDHLNLLRVTDLKTLLELAKN